MARAGKFSAGLVLTAVMCVIALTAHAQRRGTPAVVRPVGRISLGWGWGGFGYGGFGWPWWGPAWGFGFYPGYYVKPYTGAGFDDRGYPNEGFQLGAMPLGFYPFYHGTTLYYYTGGAFYRANDAGGYTVTLPPMGAIVPSLPKNAHSVIINGAQYYEYRGVYYTVQTDNKGETTYVVAGNNGMLNTTDGSRIAPLAKVGDVVDTLPDSSKKVTLRGVEYYVTADGTFYESVVKDGKPIYRVVSVPTEKDYIN